MQDTDFLCNLSSFCADLSTFCARSRVIVHIGVFVQSSGLGLCTKIRYFLGVFVQKYLFLCRVELETFIQTNLK